MSYHGFTVIDADSHIREYVDVDRTYREHIDSKYLRDNLAQRRACRDRPARPFGER